MQETYDRDPRLLRARREWPRRGRAAEKADELPSPHGLHQTKPQDKPYHITAWTCVVHHSKLAANVSDGSKPVELRTSNVFWFPAESRLPARASMSTLHCPFCVLMR